MHWCKNAPLLDKSPNTIYELPQILPKQNTDFVHFIYCTNILNWPLNFALLHGKKKKALPCQSTDRAHWSNGIDERSKCKHATIRQQLTALWSNGIQASSDWQNSSPTMLGIQLGRQSYFRVTVPLFITTLLKCSASTCAHWRPFRGGGGGSCQVMWPSKENKLCT